MLPFLKKEAALALPVDHEKRKPDQEQEYDSLEAACSDLFDALKKNDTKAGAAALRAAFELCDSEPHEEGPHVD